MKVAIDVSPLYSAHKTRGVGFYTKRLIQALRLIEISDFSVRLIKQGKIPQDVDLVHYPYFDLFWLTLPLRKLYPTVVTVHDLIPLVFPDQFPKGVKGWIKYQVQRQSLRRVDTIIADSECSKKDIIKFIGFPKEKIYVVPLAPGKEFKKLKIKKKYSLPERFVLYVGDVNYNKNIPGLVRACAKIKIDLVLVGKAFRDKSLPETQAILRLIEELRLNNRTKILGFVPTKDLVAIYNLATVYCQPSFYEGFGLPVLEAMACGTPVVCSKTSSLPEVVGDAAVFVDPNDCKSIAEGIMKLMENKKLYEDLREQGCRRARKFSWEKTAKETVKVYHEVVKRK